MEKDLIKFNNNVEFGTKEDVSKYIDKKGNVLYIPTVQLICNCEYVELDEEQMKIAIFNGQIKKGQEYEKEKVTRKVDKYIKTKKEKDKGTIIDKEIEVSKVWFVRNGLNLSSAFSNKDEAINYLNEINNKILN